MKWGGVKKGEGQEVEREKERSLMTPPGHAIKPSHAVMFFLITFYLCSPHYVLLLLSLSYKQFGVGPSKLFQFILCL